MIKLILFTVFMLMTAVTFNAYAAETSQRTNKNITKNCIKKHHSKKHRSKRECVCKKCCNKRTKI